jgi:molybdenum cofactor cytidylyltransferase
MIWHEDRCEPVVMEPDATRLLEKVRAELTRHNRITVAVGLDEAQGKLIGVEPAFVDALIALPEVDIVIVEADGAKGRSLKAPADHEPVIPSSTSVLIPVAAVDALGQPLDERTVHRPQIVARLAGAEIGQTITAELMSMVILHPQGALTNAPERARIIPLLNKVHSDYVERAGEVAGSLLEDPRVERVLLAAVAEEEPVKEVWGRVAAVVLAAGGSRRFGSPKQLLPWKGKTLLEHVVDTVLASSVQELFVVLGDQADRLRSLLGERPIDVILNEDWEEGQSSSVRVGLEALPRACQACLFVLADQPNLTSQLIDDLLTRYRRTLAPIVAPAHRGRRGNPVLFDRALFPELLRLKGDQGGRSIIERHLAQVELVEVSDEHLFLDIDRVSDYEAAR